MSHAHGLHAEAAVTDDARARLKSIRGHVEGLMRMLDDPSVYCVDLLKQIKAIRGGLDRTADVILKGHLRGHVATAEQRGDTDEIVTELMDVLKYR